MSIHKKLVQIQSRLHCPKALAVKNYSGAKQYDYRNLAGILEKVKPLLAELGCTLMIPCEPVLVGQGVGMVVEDRDRNGSVIGTHIEFGAHVYQKATAILTDIETGDSVSVSACARENEYRKGMDASQISGSAESFASKYACEHLFCLDSTDDADDIAAQKQGGGAEVAPVRNENPAKPDAIDLAEPALAVKKTVHKSKPNPRAAAAWKAFCGLEYVKALDTDARNKEWSTILTNACGKSSAAAIKDDADWVKVDEAISNLTAI